MIIEFQLGVFMMPVNLMIAQVIDGVVLRTANVICKNIKNKQKEKHETVSQRWAVMMPLAQPRVVLGSAL